MYSLAKIIIELLEMKRSEDISLTNIKKSAGYDLVQ